MAVLREVVRERKGQDLLDHLADIWSQFYKNILPTLLAIFYPIQEQGIYIRSVTLVGFRDMVLLKTKIEDVLEPGKTVPSEIKQMLLVLASVHDSTPPSENYMRLERLAAKVVRPYLGVKGLYAENTTPVLRKNNSVHKVVSGRNRVASRSCVFNDELPKKIPEEFEYHKEVTHRTRFLLGTPPANRKTANDTSSLTKAIVDNEMLDYLENRNQRWKKRDEDLIDESLS